MGHINIFCDEASEQAKEIFLKSGFDIYDYKDDADILWIRKKYEDSLDSIRPNQIINHIPGEKQITTKYNLTKNLLNHDCNDFYSESYLLSTDEDIKHFLTTAENDNSLWLLKPSHLSQGEGIHIIKDLNEFKEELTSNYIEVKSKYFTFENEEYDYIIQKYINNPLLLNNKKSEIRCYWIILSINPLRVIIYNDYTVRLCFDDYCEHDFNNPLRHITNEYQQRKHSNRKDFNELKWTTSMLTESVINQKLSSNKHFLQEEVTPKIQRAVKNVILSSCNKICNSKLYKKQKHLTSFNYFGFYGCDIILDTDLNPWILEVQKGPGLSFEHPSKAKVLLPVIKNGINILHKFKYRQQEKFALPEGYDWLIYE